MKSNLHILALVSLVIWSCGDSKKTESKTITKVKTADLKFTILGNYPHDQSLFTQGLEIHNGLIYESTGAPEYLRFTETQIGVLDTLTGVLDAKVNLGKSVFGEGITLLGDKVYQLTYKSQICNVYDLNTFQKIDEFTFPNLEGWGLTNDGTHLIMSDGTYKLTYINPKDFSKVKEMIVKEGGYGAQAMNELEYVNGFIYANVWQKNEILKIDATNGKVVAKADLTRLAQNEYRANPNIDVMNGIAYDNSKDEFLVTGKLWSKVYRVRFN
ncbi:MAG: glutamine cyclotransferase [Arcticibacterium sp.]